MKEYIICAAIHFNDGIEHPHQPDNIFDGFVVTGRRHHNCYATLLAIATSINLEERIKQLISKTDIDRQGFITNLNRFVDRKEGYQIALAANQLIHNMHDKSNPILISEDLY